ncbi:MAG: type I restriction enzyme HsdR N-terminal domain-containing protein, partial [Candidatus Paceibacterota bacterium]
MEKFQESFQNVKKIVADFEKNISYYKSSKYQEAEVRKDYLDPFFINLGWDVNHTEQKNPYKQEVKVEKTVKEKDTLSKKFADYAFYLSPDFKNPVFFVEAKKPSVKLENNKNYYLQTHKYGWNANVPLSILTDFEEFIIIDCRFKPNSKYSTNSAVKSYN